MFNEGFLHEERMVHSIDGKKYSELNPNLKNLMFELYGNVDDDTRIKCELVHGFAKPDFLVTIGNDKRYVSMKSGNASIIHCGYLDNFIKILREYDISQRTIDTITRFYHGDGTLDGSGGYELEYKELLELLKDDIIAANEELNSDPRTVLLMVNRFMFKGLNPDLPAADVLYHGDYKNGVMVTKSQVNAHIKRKNYSGLHNLHIGPLLIRPNHRYRKNTKAGKNDEAKRIVLDWAFISDDMNYIHDHYVNYYCCGL